MIAHLTGQLLDKAPTQITLDVHGVGYEVFIPLSTYFSLPDLGEPLTLNIFTHVREDAIQLFGFLTASEKEAFVLLTGISGIGGKLALSILSAMPTKDLVVAIQMGDVDKLALVPGIGKKVAGRIALELKDKIDLVHPTDTVPPITPLQDPVQADAASALANLGYRPREVKDAMAHVTRHHVTPLPLDELIRETLKVLVSR